MDAFCNDEIPAWLRAGLRAASVAPSGHNTQPWRFTWNRRELGIGWEPERHLPAGDPTGRYLLTSLGAAIESVLLTTSQLGISGRFVAELDARRNLAGTLEFARASGLETAEGLACAIYDRKTTRLPFEPAPPDSVHLGGLARLAEVSGLSLHFTRDPGHIRALAETIQQGTVRNLSTARIADEFCRWLRFPGDERLDGLSTAAMEYGRAETLAARGLLRPAALRVGRHVGLNEHMAATQSRLALATTTFGLLTAPDSKPETLINAGRGMIRLWLAATLQGLRIHPMTAGIDYPDSTTTTLSIFGADQQEHPILCFRIGHGPAGHRARKRPVNLVVE